MASVRYISYPITHGRASRQAHADFPTGTDGREIGKRIPTAPTPTTERA